MAKVSGRVLECDNAEISRPSWTVQTRKEYAEKIRQLGGHLCDTSISMSIRIITSTQAKDPTIPEFTCSFIKYPVKQAIRIAGWLERGDLEDIDLVAHATRGLFESALLYRHLMGAAWRREKEQSMRQPMYPVFRVAMQVHHCEDAHRFGPIFV